MARPMTEAVSARYEFVEKERADLGAQLADVYQERAKLDEEKKSGAAQIKEREAILESKVGSLSRQITAGFEMRSYECTLRWDDPNVGEVSYYRQDNGALIKTRAMTAAERQLDLPLQTEEQTKQNVVAFFQKGGEVVGGGKDTPDAPQDGLPTSEDLDHHTAEQAAAEATGTPEQAISDIPPDFQGSLEEYQAQQTPKPSPEINAPTSLRKPRKKS